eukprot:CAMPEP_0172487816 /NCGR_PEP_ID=MMETSP1066-20121228/17052_1 /TAXON_ID=671091 /ORGANISM="Coscinodiscus wailesii, Strain CCMP2513" /LENGTH=97 /DNA_ID=CAMNT_0013254663 /DNA_START=347 /DNA_END=636 /DNA_ORIENTATION=+
MMISFVHAAGNNYTPPETVSRPYATRLNNACSAGSANAAAVVKMAYKRRSSRMGSLVPDGEAGNDGDNAVIHHDQYHIPPHKERSILRSAQDLFEGW